MDRLISPVTNNIEKKDTYRTNIRRYNKAMKEGFFYEAMLFDYAVMEDRLRSFIYHIGLFNTRDSFKADVKRVKTSLQPIIKKYKRLEENDQISVKSISGKIKVIRCIALFAEDETVDDTDMYRTVLRKQINNNLDCVKLVQTLEEIEKWCAYRNEIVHALLNKNLNSVFQDLENQAKEGMRLCRELDNQVDKIKKGNWIRRKTNLQNK